MKQLTVSFFLLVWLTFSVVAQTGVKTQPDALPVIEAKLTSRLMAREMPYRVILPKAYETEKSRRFPVVYLLHGLTGHYDDWTKRTSLAADAAGFQFIIVTPEGDNGWYTDSGSVPNDKYESYIVNELIPEIDGRYRTIAERSHRTIAGLSMGGYGSIKFGLKYPAKFSLVGSFSGALMAASLSVNSIKGGWKALEDSISGVYGEDGSATRKANDIFALTRGFDAEGLKTLPYFYVDCGTEDGLIGTNRDFAALLMERKIPHEFRQLPGRHDWPYWDQQVKEFLRIAQKRIK